MAGGMWLASGQHHINVESFFAFMFVQDKRLNYDKPIFLFPSLM
jgi:hypothetical protein